VDVFFTNSSEGGGKMSVDLTVDQKLGRSGQYVKDQNGNQSSLSLTDRGNVGVGTDKPDHTLDVNGTLRIKSTDTGFGLHFVGSDYAFGTKGSGSLILQKGGEKTGIRDRIFEVMLEISEDRSTVLLKEFRFDNVDVFPDNDDAQSLGLPQNRWSELHVVDAFLSGSLNISNLSTPPAGVTTVDLVIDPSTGKIYRKS
jgi:hypothetical protein